MFNMPGIQIDGNNVVEVFTAAERAIERARDGEGPVLMECLTYRWRGHVGPDTDLDKGLRSEQELEHWMGRCPIKMLGEFLLDRRSVSESERDQLHRSIEDEVEEAVTFAKGSPYPDESSVLDDIFRA
jgi:pyruvate dehydrogenase E1 component alpha subunit